MSRGLRRTRAAEGPAQLGASSGAVFAPEPDARFRRRESRVAQRGRQAGIDLRTKSERPVSRILKNAISVRGCRTVLFLMLFGKVAEIARNGRKTTIITKIYLFLDTVKTQNQPGEDEIDIH